MKRRGFLRLLGAAVAAPTLPAVTPKAAVAATYNRYTFGLGVFHARTRAHVSVRGLAHRLNLSPEQARLMLAEMAERGLVTPIAGTGGSVRAVSNILKPDMWGLDRSARAARAQVRLARTAEAPRQARQADLSAMLNYLRGLCVDRGMTLSPRCMEVSS